MQPMIAAAVAIQMPSAPGTKTQLATSDVLAAFQHVKR